MFKSSQTCPDPIKRRDTKNNKEEVCKKSYKERECREGRD